MSNLGISRCKKRKRYSEDCKVFRFKSFGENGHPVEFAKGSFRENVKALLEFGHPETRLCGKGMPCWSFQLQVHRHPPLHVLLFVVEEPFDADNTSLLDHCCKQCYYVGKKFSFYICI